LVYAISAFVSGDWFFGILAVASWAVVPYFRRRILRSALEGFEYARL
jgi:hypothetical protein